MSAALQLQAGAWRREELRFARSWWTDWSDTPRSTPTASAERFILRRCDASSLAVNLTGCSDLSGAQRIRVAVESMAAPAAPQRARCVLAHALTHSVQCVPTGRIAVLDSLLTHSFLASRVISVPRSENNRSTPGQVGVMATPSKSSNPPLTVYFDGSCPVCAAEIGHYRRQAGADACVWIDAASCADAELGTGLPRDAALRRFHVRRADGRLIDGMRGFATLWATLPRYAWLGRFASFGPMPAILELAYRIFLAVRPLWRRPTQQTDTPS